MKRRILLAACAVAILALAVGTATAIWPTTSIAGGQVSPTSPDGGAPSVAPTTFAVVGDSISARASREGVDKAAGSWTTYASQRGARFVNEGWAENGATLSEMQSHVTAIDADVLVILAGTNNLSSNMPIADRLAIVGKIAQTADADRVVLSAVPPFDLNPAAATAWNAALAHFAAQESFTFVDPWGSVRSADATFVARFTVDGVHPTVKAAEIAGTKLRAAIIAMPGSEA